MRFRYVMDADGTVDIADRGLNYGDGLFETMSVQRGEICRYGLHLDRLVTGCQRLHLPVPDPDELGERMRKAAEHIESGSLKLVLTRGSGPRGYAPPEHPSPLLILTAMARTEQPAAAIRVVTLQQCLAENPALAGIKHLCRLEQVLGARELAGRHADEGLMLNTRGFVIGGTSRNLFAVLGAELVTPDLSRSGILGVMRRSVLECSVRRGIQATERDILPAELAEADELFMTNALVGIQSVIELDGRRLAPGPVAAGLRAELGLAAT